MENGTREQTFKLYDLVHVNVLLKYSNNEIK